MQAHGPLDLLLAEQAPALGSNENPGPAGIQES